MRWNMVMLRGSKIPIACLLGGVLATWVLGKFAVALPPLAADVARYQTLVQGVSLIAASAFSLLFVWRLLGWERGERLACQYCDGPLGGIEMGRKYYGRQLDDFRYCYSCGRATPDPD